MTGLQFDIYVIKTRVRFEIEETTRILAAIHFLFKTDIHLKILQNYQGYVYSEVICL